MQAKVANIKDNIWKGYRQCILIISPNVQITLMNIDNVKRMLSTLNRRHMMSVETAKRKIILKPSVSREN